MRVKRLKAGELSTLPNGRHPDGNGLYYVVRGGSRTWMLRFRFQGKRHDIGLGNLQLAMARAEADRIHFDIKQGKHPLVQKSEILHMAEVQAGMAEGAKKTPRQLFNDAVTWWVSIKALRTVRYVADTKAALEKYFALVLDVPLCSISRDAIADCLKQGWGTTHSTKALSTLRIIYRYAHLHGWVHPPFPTDWKNNLELLLPPQSKAHKVTHLASCPWTDIPAMYATLAADGSYKAKVIMALILCVPRPNELLKLDRNNIDTDRRIITIPVSKTSTEPWELPYPTQAVPLVQYLGLVGRETIFKFFKQLYPDYTLHGFRSSFSSWCADHEKNPETREACLHHSLGSEVTLAYQRSSLLENRRKLLQEWADFVSSSTPPPSA